VSVSTTVPPVPLNIVKLLHANAGSILAGLVGGLITLVGVLITRRTTRGTARLQRTDDYRREVRSAASAVLGAARTFIDAARALDMSIFWIRDAVQSTPDHEERYLACQAARAKLQEKLEYFDF
jgi:nitrate reductase gamma subunit